MSLKILVVEDDAPSLELMCEVLQSVDVQVRPIANSEEAAALVKRERFDGIFMDLQMPRMHGFELASRIRESPWNKSTPIIVVTGREERTTMQEAFKVGATFFLQKPVDRQRVLRLFRTASGVIAENRRRYVRVPLTTGVACQVHGRTIQATSRNISQGGILFESAELCLGDQVKLSFRLPGRGVAINATGVVVRVDERQRAGVQFVQMNDAGRDAIRELVDQVGV